MRWFWSIFLFVLLNENIGSSNICQVNKSFWQLITLSLFRRNDLNMYLVLCRLVGLTRSDVTSWFDLIGSNFSVSYLILFLINTLIQFPEHSLTFRHSKLTQASYDSTAKRLAYSSGLFINFKFLLKIGH